MAGLFLSAGLPPIHLPVAPLAFAVLIVSADLTTGWRSALLRGWLFGTSFFLAGLYWIGIAFFAEAEKFGVLAVPAVLLLSASLGLVPAFAMAFYRWIEPHGIIAKSLILAALWTIGELFRGQFGLWFPWNPIASVWSNISWLMQAIAWIGPHLLGALTVFAGATMACIFAAERTRDWRSPAFALFILCVLTSLGAARQSVLPVESADDIQIRIIQANIDQHHKWDPDKVRDWFFRHIDMSSTDNGVDPDVIIWPESSVPYRLELVETRKVIKDGVPHDAILLMGSDYVQRADDALSLHNSLYVMDKTGELADRYDKVNLVPFGEFLPLRSVLASLGLQKLTPGNVDFSPGFSRRTIRHDNVPAFSALICYEAIFPASAAPAGDRPDWLVNITNDAWFGKSSGPYQHLAMARMRAIEEGIPLVRAANTGISVVTDAFGNVLHQLDLGVTGVINTTLPGRLDELPLYRRAPWSITAAGLAVLLSFGLISGRRQR